MKKSALILSILVATSSIAPVVAMNNGQQQASSSRWSRLFQNIFRTDLMRDTFVQAGRAADSARAFRDNIDELVGDSKEQSADNPANIFNNMAQGVRADLRGANIPGMEKVVNDDNMSLIKLVLFGVAGYTVLRMFMNIFSSHQAEQTNNNNR